MMQLKNFRFDYCGVVGTVFEDADFLLENEDHLRVFRRRACVVGFSGLASLENWPALKTRAHRVSYNHKRN